MLGASIFLLITKISGLAAFLNEEKIPETIFETAFYFERFFVESIIVSTNFKAALLISKIPLL